MTPEPGGEDASPDRPRPAAPGANRDLGFAEDLDEFVGQWVPGFGWLWGRTDQKSGLRHS